MSKDLTKEEATKFFAELFYGEHHIPSEIKPWGHGFSVRTNRGNFATTDFNNLTRLVLMAHDQCIRAEITGSNFGYINIAIWKRQREGGISIAHPTIEQAIEKFRTGIVKQDAQIKTMTIEEFNNTQFGANMQAEYKGKKYDIATVDFEEKLVGLLMNISGGEPDDVSWVRCENVTICN